MKTELGSEHPKQRRFGLIYGVDSGPFRVYRHSTDLYKPLLLVQYLTHNEFFDGVRCLQRLNCKDFKGRLWDTGPSYSGSFKEC